MYAAAFSRFCFLNVADVLFHIDITADCLPATQTYAILVLADGGPDLESVKLSSWVQAASVFWQVVQALATAEKECEFEVSRCF